MKLQIIQLEPYDDFASVRDRLSFVNAERLLLVWPKTGAILRRKLDLVLVQREVARRNMRLALVTTAREVIENARELNISVFPSIDAGSHVRWNRPRNKVFVDRSDKPEDTLDRYELMEVASRLRPVTAEQVRARRLLRTAVALLLAGTLLASALIIAPGASVRIFQARDQLTTTVRLVADPTIAIENISTGHIPATLVSNIVVERQSAIQTSGSADVPATVASGTVILTNQTPDPLTIPAGAIVSTQSARPARFRTLGDATINGYGAAEVTIQATLDSAGPVGNIEPNLISRIEGALDGQIAVRNPNATRGGTIRQQGVVTKEDQSRLLALLRDQIRTSAVADIKLSPTQFIAPGSIQIVEERPEWTTFSNFVGDPADTLALTLKARVQALVIDELSARKAAYASLARQLNNRQIVVDSVTFQRGKIDPLDSKGMASFLITASGDAVVGADPDTLRTRLAGLSVSEAHNVIDRELLLDPRRPAQIEVWPAILARLPLLSVRIDVTIQ